MVARLVRDQEAASSSLATPTTSEQALYRLLRFFFGKIGAYPHCCSSFSAKGHVCVPCPARVPLGCRHPCDGLGSPPAFCGLHRFESIRKERGESLSASPANGQGLGTDLCSRLFCPELRTPSKIAVLLHCLIEKPHENYKILMRLFAVQNHWPGRRLKRRPLPVVKEKPPLLS